MNNEYLPPVVTELKADLSDLMAGLAEARAAVRQFAGDTRNDLIDASKAAGGGAGFAMVTQMRTTIREQMDGLGDDIDQHVDDKIVPKMAQAGADSAMGFFQAFKGLLMPMLIFAIVAASPAIAAAISGAIALGLGMGFIAIGAYMLRAEPSLIAAATRFRDRVAAVFRKASAPLLVPLITALDTLGKSFEKISPLIDKAFAALGPAIVPLATGIGKMMENMAPGLTAMLIAAGPMLIAFAEELPGIGTALGEFFQMIADNSPAIIDFIHEMGRIIPAIVRGLAGMLGFLMGIFHWVDGIAVKMRGAGWETPFHGFVTSGKAAWKWMEETGPKIKNWFTDRGDDIKEWADKAGEKIHKFTDDVGTWFSELPGKIETQLQKVPGLVSKYAKESFDQFFFVTSFGLTKVTALWVGWVISLPGLLAAGWNLFVTWMKGNIETFIEGWKKLPGQVADIATDMWNRWWIVNKANWDLFIGFMKGAIAGFVQMWWELPEKVDKALAQFWATLSHWAANVRGFFKELGMDLLRGLVSGIVASQDWANARVKEAMDKIKEGAKKALGIKSPSTVFAEIGRYSMAGYIEGITGEKGALARAVGSLTPSFGAGGTANGLALAAAGGGSGGAGAGAAAMAILVQLLLDGSVLVEKLIVPAQQRKLRTGSTGLT